MSIQQETEAFKGKKKNEFQADELSVELQSCIREDHIEDPKGASEKERYRRRSCHCSECGEMTRKEKKAKDVFLFKHIVLEEGAEAIIPVDKKSSKTFHRSAFVAIQFAKRLAGTVRNMKSNKAPETEEPSPVGYNSSSRKVPKLVIMNPKGSSPNPSQNKKNIPFPAKKEDVITKHFKPEITRFKGRVSTQRLINYEQSLPKIQTVFDFTLRSSATMKMKESQISDVGRSLTTPLKFPENKSVTVNLNPALLEPDSQKDFILASVKTQESQRIRRHRHSSGSVKDFFPYHNYEMNPKLLKPLTSRTRVTSVNKIPPSENFVLETQRIQTPARLLKKKRNDSTPNPLLFLPTYSFQPVPKLKKSHKAEGGHNN